MRNGLVFSMEQAENELTGEVDQTEAAEVAVDVAEEAAEISETSGEVDATVADVSDAVAADEELTDIAEVAEEAVESGEGLDQTSAQVASIAIETIRNRLGIYSESTVVPALESFGNTNTRMVSTKLVVEGIGDTLKRIWAAIKAAAIRIWDKIKLFVAKLFNASGMLAKHIKALQDRASKISESAKPSEKTLKASGLAKALAAKNANGKEALKSITGNSLKFLDTAKKTGEATKNLVGLVQKLAEGGMNEESLTKSIEEIKKIGQYSFENIVKNCGLEKLPARAVKKDENNYRFGPFAGNVALSVKFEKVGEQETAVFAFETDTDKLATEINALTLSEIKEALASALTTVKAVDEYKKVQSANEDIVKSTVKVAETIMKQAEKMVDGEKNEGTRDALALCKKNVNASIAILNSIGARGPSVTFAAAKAAADYASMSMRNLTTEKAA